MGWSLLRTCWLKSRGCLLKFGLPPSRPIWDLTHMLSHAVLGDRLTSSLMELGMSLAPVMLLLAHGEGLEHRGTSPTTTSTSIVRPTLFVLHHARYNSNGQLPSWLTLSPLILYPPLYCSSTRSRARKVPPLDLETFLSVLSRCFGLRRRHRTPSLHRKDLRIIYSHPQSRSMGWRDQDRRDRLAPARPRQGQGDLR